MIAEHVCSYRDGSAGGDAEKWTRDKWFVTTATKHLQSANFFPPEHHVPLYLTLSSGRRYCGCVVWIEDIDRANEWPKS